MSKIKIYNTDEFIRNEFNMACHTFGEVAIFEGKNGVVVAEKEAVHDMFDSLNESFNFDLTKIPAPGKMYILPTHSADIPISMIKEKAPNKEIEFYDFFSKRNYNPRCQNNFKFLCENLREIEYEIPKEPLFSKIMNATEKANSQIKHNRPAPEREI